MVFHLSLGQVLEQWLKVLLLCRLLWENTLLVGVLVESTELGMVGDVEEALTILWAKQLLALRSIIPRSPIRLTYTSKFPLLVLCDPSRVSGRELNVILRR